MTNKYQLVETLKTIILDFQELELSTGVSRRLVLRAMPGKAAVCIGVRRCGKSTCLFQVVERLLAEGVPRENILYINFFDDRLHELRRYGLACVDEAYYSLYPDKKNTETVYCFFDEIQVVDGWEPFVDRLMRTEKCEVYITGSSARMLSREVATQMRGRAVAWELFPFSFGEFLDYRGIDWSGPLSSRNRLLVQKSFEEYWERGGFPEVVGLEERLRTMIHQEYFHAILYRDLVERYDIAHPRALLVLAYRLMDDIGSFHSVNSLARYLKTLGHRIPKTAVSEYLQWFEDAYFLFTVPVFDASIARRRRNPKKVYCVDHAMVRSLASGILPNTGHLLENLVFMGLRRITPHIWYCKTCTGREVDFIAQMPDGSRLLVQACESLADSTTRERELSALREAMKEYGLPSAVVVTRHEDERVEMDEGTVEILPAWRFLIRCELQSSS